MCYYAAFIAQPIETKLRMTLLFVSVQNMTLNKQLFCPTTPSEGKAVIIYKAILRIFV